MLQNYSQSLQIKDLTDGKKRVCVAGKIVEKTNYREVKSRFSNEMFKICDAILADDSTTVKLTLWNEQTGMFMVGDDVKIVNGYVTSFKGELVLNVGKFGSITKI